MYVHRLGLYCILLRVLLYPLSDIALQLTKFLLKKVTTTTTTSVPPSPPLHPPLPSR